MNTVLLSACTQRNSHFSPLTPVLTEAVLLHTAERQLGVWKLNLLWTTPLLLSYPLLMDLPLFNGPVSICCRVHVSINSTVLCFIYKNNTKQLVGLVSLIKLLLSTMNNEQYYCTHTPLCMLCKWPSIHSFAFASNFNPSWSGRAMVHPWDNVKPILFRQTNTW